MKKILLLCLILITTAGCSKEELVVNISETNEVDLCEYNDDCDFTLEYESVAIKGVNIKNEDIPISISKEKDGSSYNHLLTISEKNIEEEIARIRKIFLLENVIMVYGDSCEEDNCRFIAAYKSDGEKIFYYNSFGTNQHIGGSELMSLFIVNDHEDNYYVEDGSLYVYTTALEGSTYTTVDGTKIDLCDTDALKENPMITVHTDDEGIEYFITPTNYVYEIKYNGDLTFEQPIVDKSLGMNNAIFKYCIEDKN